MKIGFGACSRSVQFASQGNEWRQAGFPNPQEHTAFKKWVKQNDLNEFGDPKNTIYMGSNPLFYSRKTLYQYASENHPQKPWNKKD